MRVTESDRQERAYGVAGFARIQAIRIPRRAGRGAFRNLRMQAARNVCWHRQSLKSLPLTVHIPLAQVPKAITTRSIVSDVEPDNARPLADPRISALPIRASRLPVSIRMRAKAVKSVTRMITHHRDGDRRAS